MPGGKRGPRPVLHDLTAIELAAAVVRLKARTRVTDSGCWVTDRGHVTGYSSVSVRNWPCLAHIVGYLDAKGWYDPSLELDHVDCESKSCWNPDHLEPVTHMENMARWREKRYGSRQLDPIWKRQPGYSTERVRAWREARRAEGKDCK